jgi:hypothetical protein
VRRRPLLLPCLFLALASTAASCSVLDDGLTPGSVVRAAELEPAPGSPATREGWRTELQLPEGLLRASVVPVEGSEVPARDTADDQDVAVDEGTLAAVSWSLSVGEGLPLAAARLVLAPTVASSLHLVAGGTRTRLDVDGLDLERGFVWTSLEESVLDDLDDLALEVEYDGEVLTTDAPRPGLDAPTDRTFAPCADVLDPPVPTGTCRATLETWPWLPEQGWADGAPWRLVRLEATAGEPDVTLDGTAPLATTVVTRDAPAAAYVLVFPGEPEGD